MINSLSEIQQVIKTFFTTEQFMFRGWDGKVFQVLGLCVKTVLFLTVVSRVPSEESVLPVTVGFITEIKGSDKPTRHLKTYTRSKNSCQ